MRIAVVGAGVIGITTAVAVKETFPNDMVTIFANTFTPHTTGNGSAGLWGPYILANTPSDNILRWADRTHKWMEQYWKSDIASEVGVTLLPVTRITTENNKELEKPVWISLVYGERKLNPDELESFSKEYKKNYRIGWNFITYTCEPTKFLPWLTKKFYLLGGKIQQKKIESLLDLQNEGYEIIINCSGLGALELCNDSLVTPIRGQVSRVAAPWILEAVLEDDDDGNYVIPNMDDVILGGTHQIGNFDISVRQDDYKFINEGCCRIFPSLKNCKVLKNWVGLRPGRINIRLEAETCTSQYGKTHLIIHNYGHGGSGITLCYGCALDVVEIIRKEKIKRSSHL